MLWSDYVPAREFVHGGLGLQAVLLGILKDSQALFHPSTALSWNQQVGHRCS
jgi:hypothetical protein